ncbi:MAG: hypothetical protein IT579_08580 [Verrucomicrobia subdivision 3 bacterium]|nr:hypothetical protein [Limisphaerales bacterium]
MAKNSLKDALNRSIDSERASVDRRFAQAEALLDSPPPVPPPPVPPVKVIRDSFTMPDADYRLIAALQQRCLNRAVAVNKAEVLRAGLKLLAALPDDALLSAMAQVERVKTGRAK